MTASAGRTESPHSSVTSAKGTGTLRRIVLPLGFGQTCNQLFQICHWLPSALRLDVPVYFPGFVPYANWFRGTAGQRLPRFPRDAPALGTAEATLLGICQTANRMNARLVEPLFMMAGMIPGVVSYSCDAEDDTSPAKVLAKPSVSAAESLWVRGWHCRDEAGMRRHVEAIREFFTPVQEIQRSVDASMKRYRLGEPVLIGVHLRRGDYKHWSDGKYLYSDETVRRLLCQTTEVFPGRRVRFLLVSNQSIDRGNFSGLDIAIGPGDPPGDLYCLAACDYLIGPPSTFTMWASFIGNVSLYCISDPTVSPQLERFSVALG